MTSIGKLARAARRLGLLAVLIVLTMILFGPAVPIDAAVLLAGAILSLAGMLGYKAAWLDMWDSARARLVTARSRMAARLTG